MQIKRTRNALVGSLVIGLARRSLRRKFGGRRSSAPAWPFFVLGVLTVFAVVAWRRRCDRNGEQAEVI